MAEFSEQIALLIERGGWIMVPLLALSVVSIALIAERTWFWMGIHRPSHHRRVARLHGALKRGDRPSAEAILGGDDSPYGTVSRRLLESASEATAVEAVESERPRIERFMVSLSTIITAAPLLGILGTVIGIIRSFRLLGAQQTLTDPTAVSAGIAEALLTTALGLVVALLTLFPYMIFRGQVERMLGRLESLIAAAQEGLKVEPASAEAEPVEITTTHRKDVPAPRVSTTAS